MKYWNGASWTTIGTITNIGWNNFSATGLNSEEYTIQFEGTNEITDVIQDSWDIDCILLHNFNVSMIGKDWTLDSNDPSSPWSWDFDFPDGDGYYQFYSIGHYVGLTESKPKDKEGYCEKT